MPGRTVPLLTRFWAKVDARGGPEACWLWCGGRTGAGYGALYVAQRAGRSIMEGAHRLAYALYHREPIPPALTVDHLCRVRHCVNPRHLVLVSRGENVLRGEAPPARNARATRCIWGHRLDAANTYVTRRGGRHCLICQRRRNRAYMARRRAIAKQDAAW